MNEVRKIINDRDFWGSATAGPEDEYDCLVAALTSHIAMRRDRKTLRSFIEKHLRSHFGLEDAYNKDNLETILDQLVALEERL